MNTIDNLEFDTQIIKIKKRPTADSRTAIGEPSKVDLLESSMMHIDDVKKGCSFFAIMLLAAGNDHDWTKIKYIDEFYKDYSQKLQGEAFKKAPWFQKHLEERHHLNDRCPDDVNLVDVIERVIDITMAGMARSGYVYDDELDAKILQRAYKNTIQLLQKHIEVGES